MASIPAKRIARRDPDGIWRVDHLEAGLRGQSEPVSGRDRVRNDGPVGTVRHHKDSVRAWLVVGIVGPTGGAAVTLLIAKGHA